MFVIISRLFLGNLKIIKLFLICRDSSLISYGAFLSEIPRFAQDDRDFLEVLSF